MPEVLPYLMRYLIFLVLIVLTDGCSSGSRQVNCQPVGAEESVVLRWASIALDATARDTERYKPRPTVTSRCLALTWIAVYDAWTRYDDRAEPVYLAGIDRVAADRRTAADKATAIGYAAYHALRHYYFADTLWLSERMRAMGLDPDVPSGKQNDPVTIGMAAAKAVIEVRREDGANESGSRDQTRGQQYGDYTGYHPVNTSDTSIDLAHWQPKYFVNPDGSRFAPACLTPQWPLVKPVVLPRADIFRSPPPPVPGSPELARQVAEVVALQAALTPAQKALVEFMRDGPSSVQQAGHWLRFAMDVARRDTLGIDECVTLFFLVTVAAMDGFIACWDTKMFYDFARPYALVHEQFKNEMITGWGGPARGMVRLAGQDWRPYSPDSFLCPPFPAYVSGHSTVSGACSEVLRLYTHSDTFGLAVRWLPGSLTEPGVNRDSVTLFFPTFSATADAAGWSRVLGGYHIQGDNLEGLVLGRNVGRAVYAWYLEKRLGN